MSLTQLSDDYIIDIFNSEQYKLLHKVGEGGFGKVFKAINKNTNQPVAIKFLTLDPNIEPQKKQRYIERFKRETQLSSQLNHPNIVRLLDQGKVGGNLLFGVFEYVEGRSLRDHLIHQGAFNPVEAADIMQQVLDALIHAHHKGIVHRDIKPANIMLSEIGAKTHIKILDFGIGTLTQEGRQTDFHTLTLTQETLGTPSYSAPEQLRGEPTSERTDLYVWGLVFLECLTGFPAVTGSSIASIYHQQLSDVHVPIPSALLGHPLAGLLRRVLIKNTTERVITGEEAFSELSKINVTNLVGTLSDSKAEHGFDDATVVMRDDDPDHPVSQNYTALTERKQITVLAMRFSVKMLDDNKKDADVIDTLFKSQRNHCIDIATRFGAYHVGNLADTCLFYFGYPLASDNDARLCARTALEVIGDLAKRNALMKQVHGIQLNVHSGIHTGVFVTYANAIPEGHVSNTAMSLSRLAGEKQILCASEARDLLETYCEFNFNSHQHLGQPFDAQPVYSLIGERRIEAFGFMRGIRNNHALIGRQEELEKTLSILQSDQPVTRIAHIQGEAGIGKSRLLQEVRLNTPQYQHLVAQCLPEHKNNALFPILTLVKYLWEMEALSETQCRALLEQHLIKDESFNDKLAVLSIWFNLAACEETSTHHFSPEVQKQLLLAGLTELILAQSQYHTNLKLLIIEDIHWADSLTLEFIAYFGTVLTQDFALFCTSRTSLPDAFKTLNCVDISIQKLNEQATEKFITALFENQPVSTQVMEVLINRTDGIPLFVEELVDMLKQKALIGHIGGKINFVSPDKLDQVPSSLRESLQQKLDSLRNAKETAQLAATIGREFEYDLLVTNSTLSENQVQNDIEELLSADLIIQQRRAQSDIYIFKHALVRDAAYESTEKKTQQQYHLSLARSLSQQSLINNVLVANHYKHAQAFIQACEFAYKAASDTYQKGSNLDTISICENYLDTAQLIDNIEISLKWQLLLSSKLLNVLVTSKGYGNEEVLSIVNQNQARLDRLGDISVLSQRERADLQHQVTWITICYHNQINNKTHAIEIAEDALEKSKALQFSNLQISMIHAVMGNASLLSGHFEDAQHSLSCSFDKLAMVAPEQHSAEFLRYGLVPKCIPYLFNAPLQAALNKPELAKNSITESLKLAEHFKHKPTILMTLNYQALLAYLLDDVQYAREVVKSSLEKAHQDDYFSYIHLPVSALKAWINKDGEELSNLHDQLEETGQIQLLSFYKIMYLECLQNQASQEAFNTAMAQLKHWCEVNDEWIMKNKIEALQYV